MSAHVVPKAKSFSEEDEKTSIESQWSDEASTTIEQAEAAEKLGIEPRRNITGITNTTGSSLEELTVDEGHAHPAMSSASAPPVVVSAHLVIAQGNDAGQEIEIRPGKSYTIGRGLDNDVVLTDIAVSRKHFDLRHEDGSWVIIDRGSGNGTVVNGNIEDNPFMLANGDTIEIGNTTFRFDHPDGAKRKPAADVEVDEDAVIDDEMSTVAGKPLSPKDIETPPPAMQPRGERPKTMPPPMPRLQPQPQPQPYPMPASTLPMPQMANRPMNAISSGPQSPTLLGAPMPMAGVQPTTLPGQGPISQMHPMYAGYPQATEIPPHSVHMLHVQQTQNKKRNDASSAIVPAPYLPAKAQPRFQVPQLTKRTKLMLGGVGLTVFAAIATVAVIKSSQSSAPQPVAETAPLAPPPTKTITPIVPDLPKVVAPPPKIVTPPPAPPPSKIAVEPPKPAPAPPTPKQVEKPVEKIVKVEPPKPAPTPPPPKQTEKQIEKIVKVEPKQARKPTPPPEPAPPPPTPPTKRVATADDARDRADTLYHAKKFNDASSVLLSASKNVSDPAEVKDLRLKSQRYSALGKAYNTGTAPGGKATEQFDSLRAAASYDRQVGGAFESDITAKLGAITPKAAIGYFIAHDLEKARAAVIEAEKLGVSNDTVKLVKTKLEGEAALLYQQAMKELSTNPGEAKEKFKQIESIVDSKTTVYQKAAKQLQGA